MKSIEAQLSPFGLTIASVEDLHTITVMVRDKNGNECRVVAKRCLINLRSALEREAAANLLSCSVKLTKVRARPAMRERVGKGDDTDV